MLALPHIIKKQQEEWNKLGNLQKGLTNKLQFSAFLWQTRPSEEVGNLGQIMPLSASCPSPAASSSQGRRLENFRDLEYLWLYSGHNDKGLLPIPLLTLILSR